MFVVVYSRLPNFTMPAEASAHSTFRYGQDTRKARHTESDDTVRVRVTVLNDTYTFQTKKSRPDASWLLELTLIEHIELYMNRLKMKQK